MSENNVGVIGQAYEDRKTKRAGVLVGRDDTRKTLTFEDSEGKQFVISNSTFRSGWRKAVAEAETVKAEEPEVVEEPVVEDTPQFESDDEAISDFIKTLGEHRQVDVQILLDNLTLTIDGVEVLNAQKTDHSMFIDCLPDMFTYSPFTHNNRNFKVTEGAKWPISFDTDIHEFGAMLQLIKEAALDINLYAYTE